MTLLKSFFCLCFVFLYCTASLFSQTGSEPGILYKRGFYKEAISACEAELKLNSNNINCYAVLSLSFLALQEFEKAYETAKLGRKLVQYEPSLIEAQAEAAFHLGKNYEALKLFQDYISYVPNGLKTSSAYYFMGEIYLRMAKYRHADIAFSAAVQFERVNSNWWVRLGYAREQAKEYRYSLEAYTKALSLNRNLTDAQKGKERVLKFF